MARRSGKRIDTWTFRKPGLSEALKIPVYMRKFGDGDRYEFSVRSDDNSITPRSNSSLGALRREVFAELVNKAIVTWSPYFLLTYSGDMADSAPDEDNAVESSGELRVVAVELGVYEDGSKCWRAGHCGHVYKGWPEIIRNHKKFVCKASLLLPATDKNRDLIRRLFSVLDRLNCVLSRSLMRQDVAAALTNLVTQAEATFPKRKKGAKKCKERVVVTTNQRTKKSKTPSSKCSKTSAKRG